MEGRAVVEKRERTGEASGLVQKGPENRENERDRLTGIERGYAIGVKGKRGKKKIGRESLTARAECLRECRERVDEGWSLVGVLRV